MVSYRSSFFYGGCLKQNKKYPRGDKARLISKSLSLSFLIKSITKNHKLYYAYYYYIIFNYLYILT